MKKYQSVLACIDDFDRDAKMLEYTARIAEAVGTEEVHLIYVSDWRPVYPIGAAMVESGIYGGLSPMPDIPLDDQKARVQHLADSTLGRLTDCTVRTHVVYGSPTYEILDYALSQNVDLIVMRQTFGEASERGSKALLARRITSRATCSVLTVPERFAFETPNILVPVRDSECSRHALLAACGLAEAAGGVVEAFNIYQIYSDYALAGITLSTHLANLENYAKAETQKLLERTIIGNVEVRTHIAPDFNADPVTVIDRRAKENGSNIIVIGAHGRTGVAGIFLGTVTEQLIRSSDIPVLAVKKKGECIGVLKAMLEVMGFEKHASI